MRQLAPDSVLELQRQAGNRAVTSVITAQARRQVPTGAPTAQRDGPASRRITGSLEGVARHPPVSSAQIASYLASGRQADRRYQAVRQWMEHGDPIGTARWRLAGLDRQRQEAAFDARRALAPHRWTPERSRDGQIARWRYELGGARPGDPHAELVQVYDPTGRPLDETTVGNTEVSEWDPLDFVPFERIGAAGVRGVGRVVRSLSTEAAASMSLRALRIRAMRSVRGHVLAGTMQGIGDQFVPSFARDAEMAMIQPAAGRTSSARLPSAAPAAAGERPAANLTARAEERSTAATVETSGTSTAIHNLAGRGGDAGSSVAARGLAGASQPLAETAGRAPASAAMPAPAPVLAQRPGPDLPRTLSGLAAPGLSNLFVTRLRALAGRWDAMSLTQRFHSLSGIFTAVAASVGLPPLNFRMTDLGGLADAHFSHDQWAVVLDPEFLQDTDAVGLMESAGTFYHEARHAEQWFLMARLQAGSPAAATAIATTLGIPGSVASLAATQPLPASHPDRSAAQEWWDSVYGPSRADRDTLHADLRRSGAASHQLELEYRRSIGTPGERAAAQAWLNAANRHQTLYELYRALPEERDAHALGSHAQFVVSGRLPAPVLP